MVAETIRAVSFQYRDAEGRACVVWCEASTAKALEAMERAYRRREQRWRERHVAFSDLGIDPGQVVARPKPMGSAWEGPRMRFSWLVGEGRTCSGPGWDPCGGARLPRSGYCLGCDRSGRDGEIPAAVVVRRRKVEPGLKGGRG